MSNHATSFSNSSDGSDPSAWRPCVEGDLADFARTARSRRRRERWNRLATVSLVVATTAVILASAGQHFTSDDLPVDCGTVSTHLAGYISGTVDDSLATRIDEHLSYCLGCNSIYHQRTDVAHRVRRESAPAPEIEAVHFASTMMVGYREVQACTCPECCIRAARLTDE